MEDGAKAFFTFFYKNGLKAQQGFMVNGEKYGHWDYWNEQGVLMKRIDYKTGTDSSGKEPVKFKGKITAFYPSGKKMMTGLITDETFSYQCSQEELVSYEEVYYLTFLDENGNSLLQENSGKVIDYHMNGNKHFVGQIADGKRSGLWQFYDPKGNLSGIGEYVNGLPDGRWLNGDLGGVNFIDNACSVNEALSQIKAREQINLEIVETLYDKGHVLSISNLFLDKY